MLVPSHQCAAASLRILPVQPWLNGAGTNWMTTRRGLPLASGARSITNKSDGAMAIQSLAGAASAISQGAALCAGSAAALGSTSDAPVVSPSKQCLVHNASPRNGDTPGG